MNPEKEKNGFPARLKQLRMQKGFSQKDLAGVAKLNRVQYNRYENGETMPSTETISKIADVLGVSVDYLLEGDMQDAAIANFEDKELLQMFEEVEQLTDESKNHIKAVINAFIKTEKHKQLAS